MMESGEESHYFHDGRVQLHATSVRRIRMQRTVVAPKSKGVCGMPGLTNPGSSLQDQGPAIADQGPLVSSGQ
jgi:hypothetical protein